MPKAGREKALDSSNQRLPSAHGGVGLQGHLPPVGWQEMVMPLGLGPQQETADALREVTQPSKTLSKVGLPRRTQREPRALQGLICHQRDYATYRIDYQNDRPQLQSPAEGPKGGGKKAGGCITPRGGARKHRRRGNPMSAVLPGGVRHMEAPKSLLEQSVI